MALEASREAVMSAISTLGYQVFRQGQFHWNSKNTPDSYIKKDGTIRCWTGIVFTNGNTYGDLIDFIMTTKKMDFIEARELAYKLIDETPPPLESYKDIGGVYEGPKKTNQISEDFIRNFEKERRQNYGRYLYLLDEALPALTRPQQKEIALKYNIGYSKMADRLIMPIRDENGNAVTLWKYNKNPLPYLHELKQEMVTPSKVKFTKGRDRSPFNLQDLKSYQEDKNGWIFLCEGEKDTLNMLGRGYRAVTLGGAGEVIRDKHLHLFEGLKIIVAYDYDKAGYEGANGHIDQNGKLHPGIKHQLEGVAAEVKVWDWELLALQQGFDLSKGFDLTDWLCLAI